MQGLEELGSVQARASAADAVLLIAALLPNVDFAYFLMAAQRYGMVCLMEVHTVDELTRVLKVPRVEEHILGINNCNLGTFEVFVLSALECNKNIK
jgi:indole-3-glycerol phosphate synthase